VPIFKKSGKQNITSERYMNIVNVANPDLFTSLADADVWNGCPNKRLIKALDRSEGFFDECLKIKESNKGAFIASVQGGFSEFERKRCIKHLSEYDEQIFGYFIDGLHRNGHEATLTDQKALKDIVQTTLENLPENKIKFMFGSYFPHVILELIEMGIDVFDTSFVNVVTNFNRALTFNFDVNDPVKRFPEIDLMDAK
jgi:queuine tRNA-ribosyltransferase subunit QTRTD1